MPKSVSDRLSVALSLSTNRDIPKIISNKMHYAPDGSMVLMAPYLMVLIMGLYWFHQMINLINTKIVESALKVAAGESLTREYI